MNTGRGTLPRFLRLVGMPEAEMAGALLGMEGGALRMVARVAKQRAIQVIDYR